VDQKREIRFAVPPFLYFASLLWGSYLAGGHPISIFKHACKEGLLGVLALVAAATIPAGYLISTISVLLLRLVAWLRRAPTYEAGLSDATFDKIWRRLRPNEEKDPRLTLYAATTFDHELLNENIHTWLFRRWNSFYVATNSGVALALAFCTGWLVHIHHTCPWFVSTASLMVVLFIAAWQSWRETMEMIEFQSRRILRNDTKETT
jgi:hypothetical protein